MADAALLASNGDTCVGQLNERIQIGLVLGLFAERVVAEVVIL